MKQVLFSAALIAIIGAGTSLSVVAQPGTGGPSPTAPAAVPLDGGASLLLAGGVSYGLRKLRTRWRSRQAGSVAK
jgi:hypothetical protein